MERTDTRGDSSERQESAERTSTNGDENGKINEEDGAMQEAKASVRKPDS